MGPQEAPRGHPECLLNRTVVLTGVLDSLQREDAEDLIKRHGGRTTGSVSGKTTYLLAGTQCGRSKIAQARPVLRHRSRRVARKATSPFPFPHLDCGEFTGHVMWRRATTSMAARSTAAASSMALTSSFRYVSSYFPSMCRQVQPFASSPGQWPRRMRHRPRRRALR